MTTPPYAWQAPIPLGAFILPEWPLDVFPENIQIFVCELARSTETPIELPALTVLSGISTAAQGKFIVQVKPDYYEPVNVWTAVALPPGSRKSAVQKAVTEPLTEWERLKKIELELVVAKLTSENKSLEVRIKEIRRKASLADDSEYQRFKQEVIQLEQEIKIIPTIPQLWTADITPENLGTLMADNSERMAVLSDESGIFDILSGRYSSGIPNLDLFLQAHSGSSVRVNRGSRSPVFLNRPALTIGLTPQPDILKGLTKTPAFRGRGLLARFLFAVPFSNLGTRTLDGAPLSAEAKRKFDQIITTILNYPESENGTHVLSLSKEAYDDWHAYALAVELKMGEDGPFVFMRDWAGKLPGAIVRISGLLHIARTAMSFPWLQDISKEDMKAAIKIGHTLAEHAMGAFDLMGADPALDGARNILSWIKRNRWQVFTFRDCHYAHKNRFKRAKDMEPSIEILIERYFIQEAEKEKKPHRPSRHFWVNPALWETENVSS